MWFWILAPFLSEAIEASKYFVENRWKKLICPNLLQAPKANPRPSASNFISFFCSQAQLFLTVGQNNFDNKIPLFVITVYFFFRHPVEYHNNHAGVNLFKKAFTTYILPVITLSVILCVPKWMELELSKQYLFKNETKNDGSVVSEHIFFWKK